MLFIIGTPIGNLDDLSYRAAKTLLSSDIILAEDTRSAQTLLQSIKKSFSQITNNQYPITIVSYYKEKEFEKLPFIIEQLKLGKNISIISESGMPIISDPGYMLIKTCIKESIPYTVIPGPSSITTALSASGLNPSSKNGGFMFLGFFPKKSSAIKQLINRTIKVKELFPDMIFIFFESPARINATLSLISFTLRSFSEGGPPPHIVIARELTKKFEEIIRGQAKDLLKREYKGEIVVLLS
jgi:16S rRNA (cytidine1402-2'-O)-methyltransferase